MAGLNPNYYAKVERGDGTPSLKTIHKLAKALNVTATEIVGFQQSHEHQITLELPLLTMSLLFIDLKDGFNLRPMRPTKSDEMRRFLD